MFALEETQAGFMAAIDHGPAHLPDRLFAGPISRIVLGMKAHANTISHARLIALEETFPRTRAVLGQDRFNERSRQFLDVPGATGTALSKIGRAFPGFLARSGEPEAIGELAQFEWAWLASYHAAEAVPLTLAVLAGLDTEALLEVVVTRHPATSIGWMGQGVRDLLVHEIPTLAASKAALLARPDAEVLVWPASAPMMRIFASVENPISIGNLFALTSEPESKDQLAPDDFMPALLALIEAGALQRVN